MVLSQSGRRAKSNRKLTQSRLVERFDSDQVFPRPHFSTCPLPSTYLVHLRIYARHRLTGESSEQLVARGTTKKVHGCLITTLQDSAFSGPHPKAAASTEVWATKPSSPGKG